MQIISINKDRLHLTRLSLSDGQDLLLDNDVVFEKSLFVGMEIDLEGVKELSHISQVKRAKARALWYLERMDYTEKALFDKLCKAGFEKTACAEVLARLCELNLVDDRRFAERTAEKLKGQNKSRREILNKLYLKGVPLDLAKEVLSDTDVDEESQIKELLQKKYSYKLTDADSTKKVFAALVRRGFSYSAVKSALKNYCEELEFCED